MMFFFYTISNKAPLHIAIEKGNLDVVQSLLSNPNIDVNCESVFIILLFSNKISKFFFFQIKFKIFVVF